MCNCGKIKPTKQPVKTTITSPKGNKIVRLRTK